MPVISLPSQAMGPFGMPMKPGDGSSGGGASTDIDGATRVGNAPNTLFSQLGNPATGVHTSAKWSWFGDNGTKFYVYGNTNEITRWEMPGNPYDPSNGTLGGTTMNFMLFLNPDQVMFNPGGTKIIFFETSGDPSIKQYDLTTAWQQGTIVSTTPSATISNDPSGTQWDRGVFADSGAKFYAMQADNGGKVVEFTCSTPGDLATATAAGSSNELVLSTAQGAGESRGIAMSSDGKRLYIGFDANGDTNEQIFQYDLSTAFDLSTATYNNKVLSDLRNDNFAEIRGMTLVNDTELYVHGLVNPSGGMGLWKYNVPLPATDSTALSREFSGATGNKITYANASTGGTGDFTFETFVEFDQGSLNSDTTIAQMGPTSVRYNSGNSRMELETSTVTGAVSIGTRNYKHIVKNNNTSGQSTWNTRNGLVYTGSATDMGVQGVAISQQNVYDNNSGYYYNTGSAAQGYGSTTVSIPTSWQGNQSFTWAVVSGGNVNTSIQANGSHGAITIRWDDKGSNQNYWDSYLAVNGLFYLSGSSGLDMDVTGGEYGVITAINHNLGGVGTTTVNFYNPYNIVFNRTSGPTTGTIYYTALVDTTAKHIYRQSATFDTSLNQFTTGSKTTYKWDSSSSTTSANFANSTVTPEVGKFKHIATVRDGTSVNLFIDGALADTQTSNASITGDVTIGAKADGSEPVDGKMYGLRVAREQIYTSTFTPPTTALVETANTDLVTLQTDPLPASKNGAPAVITGDVPRVSVSPNVAGGNVQAQESTFSGGISENAPGAGGAAGSAYAMAGSGLTSGFASEEELKTNGTYTIVADANLNINHTGVGTTGTLQEIRQAGWAWIIRNSDGAVMKSWNGMLNGDHGDSSLVNETDGPLGVTSKFVNCKFGYAVGINDNYCFLGVPYRPTGGTVSNNNFDDQRAYLFAYKLSDFSLAKVWKVNDFASQIEPYSSSPMASSFGSGFLENGMEVTNDGLYVGSYRTKSTFGNVDGGAFSYFDISNNDPANWSSTPDAVVKNPIDVVSNPTTLIGSSNFSNGDFGKGIRVSKTHADNVLVVNHVAWIHRYTRSGSSFTRTGQTNPNPAIYDGGYADISPDGKTWYAGDTTTGSQHVDAYDLDNNFNIKWSYSFTTNGSPGYSVRSYIHGGQEYILAGDGYDDTDGTDAGKLAVINADGTENKIVSNPTPNNQLFGYRFDINNGSLVTKVKPGGNSYGLQFMNGTSIFDAVDIPSLGFINMTSNYTSQTYGSNMSVLVTGVTQSADKSYYLTGQVYSKSGWLFKFNEFGAFQWAREMGQYYLRIEAVVTDSSNNVYIAGSDYGYGENFQAAGGTYDPQLLYIAKFNPSGTRQWSKVVRYNSITDNAASTYTGDIQIDSHGNLWMVGSVNWSATGLNSQTNVLYKVDSDGALGGVWYLPSSVAANNTPMGLMIDSNDNLYIAFTQYQNNGSYPHGVVAKMSIPGATGSPTYTWTKKFGITASAYYDVPYGMFKSSDGNLIVYGYTDNGGSGNNYPIFMKLNDTNGAFIWKKRYDDSYGDIYNANIDSNDKIYFTQESHNAGYTEYYFWVRQINATDGSHENIWEVDFTGNASNGNGWRFSSNTNMAKNRDGNIVLGMAPNGNASGSYEPSIWKFPSTMVTGTFGKLEVSADSSTPTDATYNAVDQSSVGYSTVTSIGGQFQTDNYNSGTYNDTVSTPTLTASRSTIKAASAPSGPQGWITTITDEIGGYGYPDAKFQSLDVDSNDNIYIGGDGGTNWQVVVKMLSDGTVDNAAYFGGSGATNNHRAIAVASDGSIFTAGEAKDVWNRTDGHTMRLTTSLTKSYDTFFGEGYNDEHFDITTDDNGNAFAVGEAQSYSAAYSQDPKGYLVKYDSSGGVARTQISTSFQRSYPQGVSSDGTNVYVIAKDQNHMFIAKVNNALSSVTWSKNWGSNSAEPRIMDIDTNSSGESAALMYESNKWRLALIDSSGNATWRITWEKASTDHGAAYPGYDFSAGYAVKLLANGSIAVLAGHMPWTTQSYKKSLYIIIFDSSGSATVQKEFRLTNSSHYLGDTKKSLAELSDGKIVMATSYYKGSNSAGSGWASSVFKFDPTDTSTAINGVHGDWEISDITDSTVGTDSTTYTSGSSASLSTNMSMYFKTNYQGNTNGFSAGSLTLDSETKTTLNYSSGGSATPSGVLFSTTGTHTWTVPADVSTISIVAVGGGGGGYGYWNVDATELRIGTGGSGGHLAYANNIYVTPGETLDVTVGAGGAKGNQFGGAYGSVSYSAQPGVSSSVSRSSNTLVLAKGGDAIGNSNSDTNVGLASYSGGSGGGHGSTVTGGGGGGGAGGYSGTGGSGGSDQFNPWSPTAPGGSGSGGGGSGGRGAGGQTSTGQGGGGVGVYGEGSSGTGGQGAGGSSGTNGSASAAGIYGGGGGAGYTSVIGAQGGVRIIWGDANTARTFPTSNVDQASSTDAETTV